MTILALGCVLDDWIVLATLLRLRCSVLRGWLAHFSLFGCYYVICNCNVANIGVVALYLLERLNDNLYYTLEKLIYWVCIYIVFPAVFFQNFVKCSHEREEGKFSDSQIFHFYENSNCSQCMLLAFEFLLFFFPLYELSVICCSPRACSKCEMLSPRQHGLIVWFLQRQFWAYSCSLLLYFLVWKFICQEPAQTEWKGNYGGASLHCFKFLPVKFEENLG